jgi:hypothetical protein
MDEGSQNTYSRSDIGSIRSRVGTVNDIQQHHRPIVVVLGMHRSGTSLCSNVLSVLGVDMADDVGIARGNDRGHWERWELVGFHDRILEHFNRRYRSLFHDLPLPPGWWAEPEVVTIRHELTSFLNRRMGDDLFGFKDPRTARLLPLWRDIFAQLQLKPRVILCLRKPAEVARSLHARDGFDLSTGEYRWLVHLSDFFRHIGEGEYCLIEYDTWFDNFSENVGKLKKFLNLEERQTTSALNQALREIIDPVLRHEASVGLTANEKIVRQFYELVLAAGHDDSARREINTFIEQFDGWTRLQRGLNRAHEAASAIAERVPNIEAEIAELQAAVTRDTENLTQARDEVAAHQAQIAELEAGRATAELRATGAEMKLVRAQSEAQARIAELEAERAAAEVRATGAEVELVRAQSEAQARIAELETERAAAEARAIEAEVELARVQNEAQTRFAEIEADQAILRIEQEAREHDHAEALASLERQLLEASDRATRAEVAGAEVRYKLIEAEEQARCNAADVASTRDEIVALREQLRAVREVGAHLVKVFRSDACSAPLRVPFRRGRWPTILTFLRVRRARLGTI